MRLSFYWIVVSAGVALAQSPPRDVDIERSHPLGLEYYQPYGMVRTDYETPHVKWGKPLAGGPILTLVMAPQWTHRETVELAQRLDIHFTPWMCFNTELLTTGGTDPAFSSYLVSQQLVCKTLGDALEQDYDVIVVGKIRWSILPPRDRFELLKKVSRGAGLVYVCPPEIDPELEIVFGKHPADGDREILRGMPWKHLPRFRSANREKLVRTSKFGKGRVVVLDYQQPRFKPKGRGLSVMIDPGMHSLTPNWAQVSQDVKWPREDEPALELGPYEYYQSLVARAVRWAAGRLPEIKFSTDLPAQIAAGQELDISITAEGTDAKINTTIRRSDGGVVFHPPGKGSTFHFSALPAGHYFLDMWARDAAGKVLEWGSQAFEVIFDNSVTKAELLDRFLDAGDFVKAKVELARPLAEGEGITAELWDLHGRLIATQKLMAEGKSTETSLGPLVPLHIMHELRVILSRGNTSMSLHRLRFPVRTRFRRDDFASIIWGTHDNSLPTFYMLKKLREVDQADVIDTLPGHAWRSNKPSETYSPEVEMDTRARNCGLANLMICPYNSRFGVLGNPKNHISDRSMANAKRIEDIGRHFRIDAQVYGPYGPFVWTHGDESHYSESPDVDWHPAALARFRRLLKEKLYPNLDALNREWSTQYKTWDAVMPSTYADARETGNFAPWLTHKLSSNVIYSEFYKQVGDFLREGGDAGARTGFDGGCGLNKPNLGSDWSILAKHVQILHSYHGEHMQSEVFRSFVPADGNTVRGMWYGTYGPHWSIGPNTIEYCHYHPWYSLFHHMNTTWFWTMGSPGPMSGYAPDLTSLGFMKSRTQALKEIRNGIGKLILSCPREDDAIAIHFSESSRIADSLYAEKTNDWSNAYVSSIGNVARSLEDAGFQYRFISYKEIEDGALTRRGVRVFFMPRSRAVSNREVEQIIKFVRQGGVVFADLLPATLTHTGAKRSKPGLTEIFPDDKPGQVTRLGKGRAVLMGEEMLRGYFRTHRSQEKKWPALEKRWEKMAELLVEHAGLKPSVRIESLEGDMPPTEIARFDAGGIEFVGFIRSYFMSDHRAWQSRIRLPRKAHVYDVRAGKYLGFTDAIARRLDYQAELLALSPYRVKAVDVTTPDTAVRGKPLQIEVSISSDEGAVTGKHGLRITLADPFGEELRWYEQNLLAPQGRARTTLPLALDESTGTYELRVKDCMSGQVGKRRFTIADGAIR